MFYDVVVYAVLREQVRHLARARQLSPADVEDCVAGFLALWWERCYSPSEDGLAARRRRPDTLPAALQMARVYVRNYGRRIRLGNYREGTGLCDLCEGGADTDGDSGRGERIPLKSPLRCRTPEEIVVDGMAGEELLRIVQRVLAKQAPLTRECFTRIHWRDESATQVAADTGQSLQAVRQSAYRGRVAIQQELRRREWDVSA